MILTSTKLVLAHLSKLHLTVAAGLVLTLGLVGCSAASGPGEPGDTTAPREAVTAVFPASQVDPLVAAVVKREVKPLPTTRLAEGLLPPTNRWFSGLVFGDQPQPVFPLPLSFGLTETGFAFGQPKVTATEKNIAGAYTADVGVDLGTKSAVVSAYDTVSVTVDSLDGAGAKLGHTVIAEGSPFVSYHADQAGTITTAVPWTQQGDLWTTQAAGTTYALVTKDATVSGSKIDLKKDGFATWFPVPTDGSAEAVAAVAKDPLTGGSATYKVDADTVSTTLSYASEGKTAYAMMPHQTKNVTGDSTCDLGTYPSIYGTLTLCAGNELSWKAPLSEPTSALDVDAMSSDDKAELSKQVAADIAATPDFPADTYFGGKAVYRAAMLYQLADQLGATEAAASMKERLVTVLDQWTDPTGCDKREAFCFVYDEQAKGLVGLTPSFGSEEFNDHHFHYGYFLYAAGVLGEKDPSLVTKWAPVMNLLAADIGSFGENKAFPDLRVFDVYASHSWASGTSPFADGNNQESSSEAITAWTGLAIWAKASGNADLETEATWLLSLEAQAGLTYWTNIDRSESVYTGYGHEIVTLNWGGKRDYATWFSPEPAAMLGILVIPMSPASTYLGGDSARIDANVKEATGGKFDQKFGDYLLMYSGLAGETQREAALSQARTLDAKWIDDGNSRAYMLAWLMSLKS
ncbi:MAG TPA: glycosyl hydrolase [Propionibacteriaceae bacterium]